MTKENQILNDITTVNNSQEELVKRNINNVKNENLESETQELVCEKQKNTSILGYINTKEIRRHYDVSIYEIYQVLKDVTPKIDKWFKYWNSTEVHRLLNEYLDLKDRIATGYISNKAIAQKYNVSTTCVYYTVRGIEYLTLNGCKYWDSKVVEEKMKALNDVVTEYNKYSESKEWLKLGSIPVEVREKVKELINEDGYTDEQIKILYNGYKFVPLISKEFIICLQHNTQIKKNKLKENLKELYDPQKLNKLLEDLISERVMSGRGKKFTIEQVCKILDKDDEYIIKQVSNLSYIDIGDIKDMDYIEEGELINILKLQGYLSVKEISTVTGIHQTTLQRSISILGKYSHENIICFCRITYVHKDLVFKAIQNCLKAMTLRSDNLKEILDMRVRLNENPFTETFNLALKFLEKEINRLNKSTMISKKEEFGRSLNAIECILELIDKELPQYSNEEVEKLILNPNLKKSHLVKAMIFINFVRSTLVNKCNYTKQVGLSLIEQLKQENDDKKNESKTYTEKEWADYYIFLSNIDKHILKSFNDKRYAEIWLYCVLQLSVTWRSKDIINKVPNIPLEVIDVYEFEWFKCEKSFTLSMAIKVLDSVAFGLDGNVAYKNKMNLHFNIPLSLKIPTAIALTICEIHRRKNNDEIIFSSLKIRGPRHRTDFKSFFSELRTLSSFSNIKASRTLMSLNYATAIRTIGMAGVAYVLNQYSRSHKAIEGRITNTTAVYLNFSNLDGNPEDVACQTIEQGYCGFLYSKLLLSCLPKEAVDLMSQDDLTKLIKDTRTILSPLTIEKMSEQISYNKINLDLGMDIITGMASVEKASSEKREELIKAIEKQIVYRYKIIVKKMFSGNSEQLENFINEKCSEIILVFNECVGKPEVSKKILKGILNIQNAGYSDYCNCIFDEVERMDKCPFSNPDTCIGCRYNILNLMQLYEVNKRLNRVLDKMLTDEYLMETDYIKYTHLMDNYLFIIIQAKMQYENLDGDVLSSFLNEMEIKNKIQKLQELNRILYIDKYEEL